MTADSAITNLGYLSYKFKHFQFSSKAQLGFLEDLYVLINDGIPANRAVDMVTEASPGVAHEVGLTILEAIAAGQPLAEGMRPWFAPNVVELVRIGESGGALAQTIKSAINMLQQRGVAMSSFIVAVTYPIIVLFFACILIMFLDNQVFSQFRTMKPEDRWPDAGKRLVWLSKNIRKWWWLAIIFVVAIVIIFGRIMTSYTGALRATLDRYPPFSFYRKFTAAHVLQTLGILVANGVVFKAALHTMNYSANPYLTYHLSQMEEQLSMGKSNIADVLETGLIDKNDLIRLRVMAEVKGFEHGLVRLGLKAAEDATNTLKLVSRIVGFIFLALDGYLIIMILLGLFLTAQSMAQQ